MSQTEIRLDDLLARNLSIDWFEAVAVIQAACRVVRERGEDGFPSAADLLLHPDGDVSVVRVGHDESGAAAAARLLADMARDTLPIQLRLVVSQATATESGPFPLAELSKSLAFFERPDSRQILQQLFARACLAAPRVDERVPSPEPAVRDDREKRDRSAEQKSAARKKTRKKNQALAVAIVVCLAVASAGTWFVVYGHGAARVAAGIGAVQDMIRAQFGGTSTAAAAPAVERAEVKKGSTQRPGSRTPAASPAGRRVMPAADRRAAPKSVMLLPAAARDTVPAVTPPAASEGRVVEYATVEVFAEVARDPMPLELRSDLLYNAQDPGVTPPRAIYPQLPAAPSTVLGGQTVIELIVNADGRVERARLRSVPRNVIEIMLLSAAKAWRFQPARVDGVPVRFIHRVVIAPEFLSRGSF